MTDAIMSVLMLTGVVLTGGAVYIYRLGEKRRAILMIIAAIVMFANVGIWLIPVS